MTKEKKIYLSIIFFEAIAILFIILSYESYIDASEGAMLVRKKYTPDEVTIMIKKLPTYQGDSLIIDKNGVLSSTDGLIQSVIDQMYLVPANLASIRSEATAKSVPEPYVVYQLAIQYYIAQYGDKTKKNGTQSESN